MEGEGLGKHKEGHVLPVALRHAPHFEGVGLGCTQLPDAKVLARNVESSEPRVEQFDSCVNLFRRIAKGSTAVHKLRKLDQNYEGS